MLVKFEFDEIDGTKSNMYLKDYGKSSKAAVISQQDNHCKRDIFTHLVRQGKEL